MKEKLKMSTKLSIGWGIMGEALLTGIVTSYIVYFGTNILALPALIIGNILLVSRILDGVSDLAMGVILDRTNTKHGKARPWILWTCVPFAVFSILIFAIPVEWNNMAKIIGLFLAYNLYALAYTALAISSNTLTVLLTKNSENQVTLTSVMMFSAILGNIVINAIAVGALTKLSKTTNGSFTQGGFLKLVVILGIVSALGGLMTFLFTKECSGDDTIRREKGYWIKPLKALLHNKYWFMQTGVEFAHFIALYSRLTTMIYFVQYIQKNLALTPILVLADQLPGLLVMPIAAKLCNRYGKRNCTLIGSILSMMGLVMMMLNTHNLPIFIAGMIIRGVFYAPYQCTTNAFIADTAVYGMWKDKVNVEAMAFSATSFAQKIGQGLSGSIIGYVLAFTGFSASATSQTSRVESGIIFLYIGITVIATLIQILLLFFYDLDGKLPKIREKLEQKKQ